MSVISLVSIRVLKFLKLVIKNYLESASSARNANRSGYTGQQNKYFFQNALKIYTFPGAEWCHKHDVALSFFFKLNRFPVVIC